MADIQMRRQSSGIFAAAFNGLTKAPANLQTPDSRGGWYPIVREGFTGAWQQNIETPIADVLSHPTVYACLRTISGDIAKMRLELVEHIGNDVWRPVENAAFSPVIRRPNHYQTPYQFVQSWVLTKLASGNSYTLVQRDGAFRVRATYVLDPFRVRPLIAPDGSVFYELKPDNLSQLPETVNRGSGSIIAPASEIMHDRINTLFHPLVGISPLYAAGIPAILGLKIQNSSTHFFGNGAVPGGLLTLPGTISRQQALEMKDEWIANFTGANAGGLAILSEGMKYENVAMMNSEDAQTAEHWDWASQAIATAFGVPFHFVGGPPPAYGNVQAINVQYLTQCLQNHTRPFEEVYELGIGLAPDKINGARLGVQFNTGDLLLMDTATQMDTIGKGIAAGVLAINEGRAQVNLPPVTGGNTPYLQQQNFPLESMANRTPPDTTSQPAPAPEDDEDDPTPEMREAMAARRSSIGDVSIAEARFELALIEQRKAWPGVDLSQATDKTMAVRV